MDSGDYVMEYEFEQTVGREYVCTHQPQSETEIQFHTFQESGVLSEVFTEEVLEHIMSFVHSDSDNRQALSVCKQFYVLGMRQLANVIEPQKVMESYAENNCQNAAMLMLQHIPLEKLETLNYDSILRRCIGNHNHEIQRIFENHGARVNLSMFPAAFSSNCIANMRYICGSFDDGHHEAFRNCVRTFKDFDGQLMRIDLSSVKKETLEYFIVLVNEYDQSWTITDLLQDLLQRLVQEDPNKLDLITLMLQHVKINDTLVDKILMRGDVKLMDYLWQNYLTFRKILTERRGSMWGNHVFTENNTAVSIIEWVLDHPYLQILPDESMLEVVARSNSKSCDSASLFRKIVTDPRMMCHWTDNQHMYIIYERSSVSRLMALAISSWNWRVLKYLVNGIEITGEIPVTISFGYNEDVWQNVVSELYGQKGFYNIPKLFPSVVAVSIMCQHLFSRGNHNAMAELFAQLPSDFTSEMKREMVEMTFHNIVNQHIYCKPWSKPSINIMATLLEHGTVATEDVTDLSRQIIKYFKGGNRRFVLNRLFQNVQKDQYKLRMVMVAMESIPEVAVYNLFRTRKWELDVEEIASQPSKRAKLSDKSDVIEIDS